MPAVPAGASGASGVEAHRALVLSDRQPVADLVELTLNHGLFVVRTAPDVAAARASAGVSST